MIETNQKVKVYEDPFNEKNLEGIAITKRFLKKDNVFEYWQVVFTDDKYSLPVTRKFKISY